MQLLTAEQTGLKKELRAFADAEIMPAAAELDKQGAFPQALLRRLGELGYLDASFAPVRPEAKYKSLEAAMIIEELSRGLASLGLVLSPHYQCMDLITAEASDTLRRRVLEPALSGQTLLAFALSEERGGSDALGIDTTAVRTGDGWLLNGKKCWITNAGYAGGYVVAAKSPASGRSRSVSLFYVSSRSPGFTVCENDVMIGMRSSPIGSITMDNCLIPADCIIGPENGAYPLMKILLNVGRMDTAAIAVGIAQCALESVIAYTSTVGQYGRSLSSYQSVSFAVADMYAKITASRNSLYHVASLIEAGLPATTEVAALKLSSTEMCCQVCASARQLFGAKGLISGSLIDRCFRDSQLLTTSEGTSEICRIVVANSLYRSAPGEL